MCVGEQVMCENVSKYQTESEDHNHCHGEKCLKCDPPLTPPPPSCIVTIEHRNQVCEAIAQDTCIRNVDVRFDGLRANDFDLTSILEDNDDSFLTSLTVALPGQLKQQLMATVALFLIVTISNTSLIKALIILLCFVKHCVKMLSAKSKDEYYHYKKTTNERYNKCKNRTGMQKFNKYIKNFFFDEMYSKTNELCMLQRTGIFQVQSNFISSVRPYIYPVRSLKQYINRVQNEGPFSLDIEMCYEIRRFQSFSSVQISASPMRLSQSGFYATGAGDETRCFSCGVINRNWQMMDKPDQIHRSLSPGCLHLTTGDPRNVPNSSRSSNAEEPIAGIVEEYPASRISSSLRPPSSLDIVTTRYPRNGPVSTNSNHSSDRVPGDAEQYQIGTALTSSVSSSLPAAATAVSGVPSAITGDATNLDIASAVYPQFKDISSRLNSYQHWGFSHIQDPKILTQAGFYYAGYRDCVRCFYCGVGLRTWEKEDDPWVMHVRWRSSCDYIRETRGEEFIIQALTSNPSSSGPPSMLTSGQVSFNNNLTASRHVGAPSSQVNRQEIPTHSAGFDVANRAAEMGFKKSDIERAISELMEPEYTNRTRGQNGVIQLELLLEKLLLLSEETSVSPTPAIEIPPGTQAAELQDTTVTSLPTAPPCQRSTSYERPADCVGSASLTSTKTTKTKKGSKDYEQTKVLSPDEERQLEEENHSLREEGTCKICMDNPSCIVFLPCGHLVTCAECAPALRKCPICREIIRGSVRAHTVTRNSRS